MKRYALTEDGRITMCSSNDENVGKGRCNHIAHQLPGETKESFIIRSNIQLDRISIGKCDPIDIKELKGRIEDYSKKVIELGSDNDKLINLFVGYSATLNSIKQQFKTNIDDVLIEPYYYVDYKEKVLPEDVDSYIYQKYKDKIKQFEGLKEDYKQNHLKYYADNYILDNFIRTNKEHYDQVTDLTANSITDPNEMFLIMKLSKQSQEQLSNVLKMDSKNLTKRLMVRKEFKDKVESDLLNIKLDIGYDMDSWKEEAKNEVTPQLVRELRVKRSGIMITSDFNFCTSSLDKIISV